MTTKAELQKLVSKFKKDEEEKRMQEVETIARRISKTLREKAEYGYTAAVIRVYFSVALIPDVIKLFKEKGISAEQDGMFIDFDWSEN